MIEPRIEWIHLDSDAPDALIEGDLVSAAAGGLPTYRVVAVADRMAWVRDEEHAVVRLLPISRLHWKICAPAPVQSGLMENQVSIAAFG